jgi:hypothetical protein
LGWLVPAAGHGVPAGGAAVGAGGAVPRADALRVRGHTASREREIERLWAGLSQLQATAFQQVARPWVLAELCRALMRCGCVGRLGFKPRY